MVNDRPRGTREPGRASGLMGYGREEGARSHGGATGSTGRGGVWESEVFLTLWALRAPNRSRIFGMETLSWPISGTGAHSGLSSGTEALSGPNLGT